MSLEPAERDWILALVEGTKEKADARDSAREKAVSVLAADLAQVPSELELRASAITQMTDVRFSAMLEAVKLQNETNKETHQRQDAENHRAIADLRETVADVRGRVGFMEAAKIGASENQSQVRQEQAEDRSATGIQIAFGGLLISAVSIGMTVLAFSGK